MTAHETAIAYDVFIPVARCHARTCKDFVCPQAAHAPCLRHSLTPCRAQFCFTYEALQTPLRQSGPCNAHNQQVGTIENA